MCKLERKQSDTPVSLYNAPVTVITMIDNVNMSGSISVPNRSISSVPPSPQHAPFSFVHSSRSLGLASSNIIPRRHAAIKNTQKELPLICNSRIKSIQANASSLLSEFDFVVAPNNSPITLTNTLMNDNGNTVLCHNLNNDSDNVTTNNHPDNKNNIMPIQPSLSPLSYCETQHSDSGYHDSIVIADQSLLLSSSSVDHSLDLQQSPTFLLSLQQYDLSSMNILDNEQSYRQQQQRTTAETMTSNAVFSETIDMSNGHYAVDKHINALSNKNNQFVYSKLEIPIPVTQSISVSLSSTSSSSSTTSSISSPCSGPSSANSTTVMLPENPNSFKYHLNRQKSESQLLTDRHDSFDDIPWDIQLTPLY
ncbi:tyrosine kinase [Schistosoma japonicum]|nr:tyrosine kinase [Schistosoma japonicum]KAH8856646.1 tyrosine kinase [Schistosoma japonicum]